MCAEYICHILCRGWRGRHVGVNMRARTSRCVSCSSTFGCAEENFNTTISPRAPRPAIAPDCASPSHHGALCPLLKTIEITIRYNPCTFLLHSIFGNTSALFDCTHYRSLSALPLQRFGEVALVLGLGVGDERQGNHRVRNVHRRHGVLDLRHKHREHQRTSARSTLPRGHAAEDLCYFVTMFYDSS